MVGLMPSVRSRFQYSLPLEPPEWLFCDVHEAIQAHPIEYHGIESMPVIECQSVVYYASRNLVTGVRSYVPSHPITILTGEYFSFDFLPSHTYWLNVQNESEFQEMEIPNLTTIHL